MMNCNVCGDQIDCKYNHMEELCSNCIYDDMFFESIKLDPCNTCNEGSNYKASYDYFDEAEKQHA